MRNFSGDSVKEADSWRSFHLMQEFTTNLFLPEMQPERPSVLIVHREGVGDDILSIPFLSILAAELKDHNLYLLIGPARGTSFAVWIVIKSWNHGNGRKSQRSLACTTR